MKIIKIIREEWDFSYHTLVLDNDEMITIKATIANTLLGEKIHTSLIWDWDKIEAVELDNKKLSELIIKDNEKEYQLLKKYLKTMSYQRLPITLKNIYSKLNQLGYKLK